MKRRSLKKQRATYKNQVEKLTRAVRQSIPGYRPGYVMDHKVPKRFCRNHADEITPEMCASRENLHWVHRDWNCEKGTRLSPESFDMMRAWDLDYMADQYEQTLTTPIRRFDPANYLD